MVVVLVLVVVVVVVGLVVVVVSLLLLPVGPTCIGTVDTSYLQVCKRRGGRHGQGRKRGPILVKVLQLLLKGVDKPQNVQNSRRMMKTTCVYL